MQLAGVHQSLSRCACPSLGSPGNAGHPQPTEHGARWPRPPWLLCAPSGTHTRAMGVSKGFWMGGFTAAAPATLETPSERQGYQGLLWRVTLSQPQSQRRCQQPWRASCTHVHALWGPGRPPAPAGQQQPPENWPPAPPD